MIFQSSKDHVSCTAAFKFFSRLFKLQLHSAIENSQDLWPGLFKVLSSCLLKLSFSPSCSSKNHVSLTKCDVDMKSGETNEMEVEMDTSNEHSNVKRICDSDCQYIFSGSQRKENENMGKIRHIECRLINFLFVIFFNIYFVYTRMNPESRLYLKTVI